MTGPMGNSKFCFFLASTLLPFDSESVEGARPTFCEGLEERFCYPVSEVGCYM